VKLLVQPGDGVMPLVKAINKAKQRVEIVIFRFDRSEIETALVNAVSRGVFVHALIAYTNRGGEKNLRKLEMRLLAEGVTVARTSGDLARYHGKMMIVDRRELHVLAFNFTYLDMDHSRSFGLITGNKKLVAEAVKLFEADTKRQPYSSSHPDFVVSPVNARKQLSAFLQGATKQLLIYDVEISDPDMVRTLEERARAGVDIKVIGRLTQSSTKLEVRKLSAIRLHTRTIIRDSVQAFIGSQSLRELELNARREIGVIFTDRKIVSQLIKTFAEDWESAGRPAVQVAEESAEPVARVAKRVAKAVVKELPPFAPVVEGVVKELVGSNDVGFDPKQVEETVKEAVKEAVRDAVRDVVEVAVERNGHVVHK
jgi:phosphatidylserine/phosphatidylglycerophosphate/cardiolipin synthase-like enzyme